MDTPEKDWPAIPGQYGCTYDDGYSDGESSIEADYDFWFHDVLMLPDEWDSRRCKDEIERVMREHFDPVTIRVTFDGLEVDPPATLTYTPLTYDRDVSGIETEEA